MDTGVRPWTGKKCSTGKIVFNWTKPTTIIYHTAVIYVKFHLHNNDYSADSQYIKGSRLFLPSSLILVIICIKEKQDDYTLIKIYWLHE